MKTEKNIQPTSKSKKRKTILVGLGVAMSSVLGYFGWQYWKRKKISEMDVSTIDETTIPKSNQKKTVRQGNDNFPLKRGSKGANVTVLQRALLAAHGVGILPKFGADGDFGAETEEALKKLKLPLSIDQATFQKITNPQKHSTPASASSDPVLSPPSAGPASTLEPKSVASEIFKAITRKDIKAALSALKKLTSTHDYSAVSTAFQTYRVNGVKQTLVNGLLNTFKTAAQKNQLQTEFSRMGLRYDGSKWSLSGLDGVSLITTGPTVVWQDQQTPIRVSERTVLGKELTRRNEHVVFENKGARFLVRQSDVAYFNT